MLRRKRKYGQAVMEYLVLVIFLVSAFLVFQKYIVRAMSGRWKMVGDTWGHGRVWDPNKTEECLFDFRFTNLWYSKTCYDTQDCDCESSMGIELIDVDCQSCVEGCVTASPMCN